MKIQRHAQLEGDKTPKHVTFKDVSKIPCDTTCFLLEFDTHVGCEVWKLLIEKKSFEQKKFNFEIF